MMKTMKIPTLNEIVQVDVNGCLIIGACGCCMSYLVT